MIDFRMTGRAWIRSVLVCLLGESAVRQIASRGRRLFDRFREYWLLRTPVVLTPIAEIHARRVTRAAFTEQRVSSSLIWQASESEYHVLDHRLDSISIGQDKIVEMLDDSFFAPPRYFVRLRNALVWPRLGMVMSRRGRVISESVASVRWSRPQLQGVKGIAVRDGLPFFQRELARPEHVIETPSLLLCNSSYSVFGHWLMDCLPGAVTFQDEIRAGKLRILAPPLQSWHREFLDRLGFSPAVDEIANEIVVVRDLIVSSYLGIGEVVAPSNAVRRTFSALKGSVTASGTRPNAIYLSRAGMTNRRMLNEPELEEALAGLGFVSVQPETLSAKEQIEIFSSAKVVLGAHGSGMANIGYAAPCCLVVEILPSGFSGVWIHRLSAVLGHKYAYIVSPCSDEAVISGPDGAKHFKEAWSYQVDINLVRQLAESVLRQSRIGTEGG